MNGGDSKATYEVKHDHSSRSRRPAPRRSARPRARTVHDWSRSSVETRLEEAVRLRQAERELERDVLPEVRAAFNRAKRKERARAFGALFD